MNISHSAAVVLLAVSASSYAADPAVAPDIAPASTSAQSATRTQVRLELQQAIANGEIRHGDLVDFHDLVTPAAAHGAPIAGRHEQIAPANAGVAAAQPADRGEEKLAGTASTGR